MGRVSDPKNCCKKLHSSKNPSQTHFSAILHEKCHLKATPRKINMDPKNQSSEIRKIYLDQTFNTKPSMTLRSKCFQGAVYIAIIAIISGWLSSHAENPPEIRDAYRLPTTPLPELSQVQCPSVWCWGVVQRKKQAFLWEKCQVAV